MRNNFHNSNKVIAPSDCELYPSMRTKLIGFFIIALLLLVTFLFVVPRGLAEDTTLSYKLTTSSDNTFSTLNVVVPATIVDYYAGLSHVSASVNDFPKFVTPYAVKPIADCLRTIYPDDEDFVNGVLMMVHQIPYEIVTPAYYPVEILVRNRGDCDLFSLLAASILKAGGLDVILLHYASEEHMNIGVILREPPKDARLPIFSVKDRYGIIYYVAETTSTNWQEGWRIGECPETLHNAQVTLIPLETNDIITPGQVSASFTHLDTSAISLTISPTLTVEGHAITINGKITPSLPNQDITLYFSTDKSSWYIQNISVTQSDGHFTCLWKSTPTGLITIRASWSGNAQYAGAISITKTVLIIPFYLIGLAVSTSIAVLICLTLFIRTRKNRQNQNLTIPENANHKLSFTPDK